MHIIVPESQNDKSLRAQPCITRRIPISFGGGVLTAIDLDNQLRLQACKVRDIGTDWKLTSKGGAQQSMCA
jgi:hypothetical protein